MHHQVSGELLARADDALAVTQFGNALDWNLDLIEVLVEALDLNSPLDRFLDRFFAAALHLDDVPLHLAVIERRHRRRRLGLFRWLRLAGFVR